MAQGFSLKDELFNAETVTQLANHFEEAGVFASAPFVNDVLAEMPPLELKARINLIADVLERYLPEDFEEAADAILRALPPPLDPTRSDDDFGHFIYAPLGVFVERHALENHSALGLDLLEALTQRFSMEFSLRAFLNRWPEQTLAKVMSWTLHPHYHVRRLASEGTRPRLPWGQNVALTTDQTLPILDRLYADPTRFVTRSVANHLNDITKKNASAVIERLALWQKEGKQNEKELLWMRKHALRGLIKAGDKAAMAHLGYDANVALTDAKIEISPQSFARGSRAEIAVNLSTRDDAPLIVDYAIDFVTAKAGVTRKVFKLKIVDARAGKPQSLRKVHHFKDNATTFTLYPGDHVISLQVNGRVVASQPFTLG
ncbi:hypothetical protein [Yoonia litorea]|uniref:3-methyladenine DNA glycosylase AlkC n=1 Tax=Yoonia litorea TaxID=1123755 RepID=A0A1I6LUG4_9RHOB|nr:hypothetical protein [Yoonia litorea]SFS07079.1 3-methyladenine DNA glycosylase AlkC [Yoonia litorea]